MAAEDFDDGGRDIPGGVTGAAERVLVVGAGIAGLTTSGSVRPVPGAYWAWSTPGTPPR